MKIFWDGFEKAAGIANGAVKAVGATLNYKDLMKEFVAKKNASRLADRATAAVKPAAAAPVSRAAGFGQAAASQVAKAPLSPAARTATAGITQKPYSAIKNRGWSG